MATTDGVSETTANGHRIKAWDCNGAGAEQQARELAAALPRGDDRIDRIETGAFSTQLWLTPPKAGVTTVADSHLSDVVLPDGYEIEGLSILEDGTVNVAVQPKQ